LGILAAQPEKLTRRAEGPKFYHFSTFGSSELRVKKCLRRTSVTLHADNADEENDHDKGNDGQKDGVIFFALFVVYGTV
jgi:hypothetical protein